MNIKQISKTIFGMIFAAFVSGIVALLCTGVLIFIFGLSFWILDDFVFDFLNLSPKFEYDVLVMFRSVFFWSENTHFMLTFFILWAIILFAGLKWGWIKKKLTLTKETKNYELINKK